jgi:nicotinamide mononucleotide adenylyltransferase
MSKFTSIVDEALTKQQQADAGTTAAIAAAKAAEVAGKKDPTKKPSPVQRKLLQGLKKATMAAGKTLAKVAMQSNKPKGTVIEAEGDEVAPAPAPDAPAPAPDAPAPPVEPAPLTTEGEVFYVNLSRKCLFVDLDNADLNDQERQAITQDVQPENAKEIAKILRKVVSDYGLGENFDSKIDALIEDLKKNDRVVVLVPGSFKPPHKGHYEMVRQYSETYSQGHVHVLISAPSANSERRTKDGKLITPAAAKQIFELYVQPLNNVTISVSEFPSPVTAAFESLKTLDPGTTVILGASKKDNDWKRWTSAQSWAEKEGLELDIANPEETAVDVVSNNIGRPYSASNIRDNFDNFEQIKTDIPEHVSPEEIKVIFDSL